MSDAGTLFRRMDRPWSEAGLAATLETLAQVHNFSHAAVFTIPSSDDAGAEMRPILTNWNEEFRAGFERSGLSRYSLVMKALRADPLPLVWDLETLYGHDPQDADAIAPQARILVRSGCRSGAYLPVHGLTSFNGVLWLAGDRDPPQEEETADLHQAAFLAFGILAAIRFEENKRNNPLSARERDCLKLAMLGKTSSEIGTILALSEYTVSQYLASATRKVNASNRTHAVALAAQLGYLS